MQHFHTASQHEAVQHRRNLPASLDREIRIVAHSSSIARVAHTWETHRLLNRCHSTYFHQISKLDFAEISDIVCEEVVGISGDLGSLNCVILSDGKSIFWAFGCVWSISHIFGPSKTNCVFLRADLSINWVFGIKLIDFGNFVSLKGGVAGTKFEISREADDTTSGKNTI